MTNEDIKAAEELALDLSWVDAILFLRDQTDDGSLKHAASWATKIGKNHPDSVLGKSVLFREIDSSYVT